MASTKPPCWRTWAAGIACSLVPWPRSRPFAHRPASLAASTSAGAVMRHRRCHAQRGTPGSSGRGCPADRRRPSQATERQGYRRQHRGELRAALCRDGYRRRRCFGASCSCRRRCRAKCARSCRYPG
ncbi:hypothetical protein E4417_16755 [Stenotrophomonas maltophilia]|nr:hypothetical protein E4417_16755 [Stenotrophomonas maltophilia]